MKSWQLTKSPKIVQNHFISILQVFVYYTAEKCTSSLLENSEDFCEIEEVSKFMKDLYSPANKEKLLSFARRSRVDLEKNIDGYIETANLKLFVFFLTRWEEEAHKLFRVTFF
jgi:hypothetical protein